MPDDSTPQRTPEERDVSSHSRSHPTGEGTASLTLDPTSTSTITQRTESDGSENDHERPVREKLKKATLGALQNHHGELKQSTAAETGEVLTAVDLNSVDMQVAKDSTNPDLRPTPPTSDPGPQPAPVDRSFDMNDPTDAPDVEARETAFHGGLAGTRPTGTVTGSNLTSKVSKNHTAGRTADLPKEARPLDTSERIDRRISDPSGSADESMGDTQAQVKLPRKKRSRDQFNQDLEGEDRAEQVPKHSQLDETEKDLKSPISDSRPDRTFRDEPEKKRHRDTSQEAAAKQSIVDAKVRTHSLFRREVTVIE